MWCDALKTADFRRFFCAFLGVGGAGKWAEQGGFVLSLCCGDTNNCCNVCGAYRANYKKFAVAVTIAR